MIKHSDFDYSYDYLRFDATWKFEWSYDDMTGRKLYPFIDSTGNKTWYFRNPNIVMSESHNEALWESQYPYLEYKANAVEQWDATHPNNPTRYLAAESSFVTLTNYIETVIVDNVPPEFVSDSGTDYIYIKTGDTADAPRHIEIVLRDEVGLDFKQFAVSVGSTKLIEYNRKEYKTECSEYVDTNSLHIKSDGLYTYKIEFTTTYGSTQAQIDELNEQGLTIRVYDLSANYKDYIIKASKTASEGDNVILRKWVLIESEYELTDLQPCVVKFYDKDPENMIVEENANGSVWCSIYNPNEDFWLIPISTQLSETSIGTIDLSSYDDSEYETTGLVSFKIDNINEYGDVEVEAWLEAGNKSFDDILKSSTYGTGSCGPWLVLDADGRKYDIKRYLPKYLKNTDYGNFIDFFQLYLNSVYTNLSKGTNISILEKIAHINNFNDMDVIEPLMAWHFAKSHGMEFNINFDLMKMLDPTYYNVDANGDLTVLTSRTDDDILDIVKYGLKNLPFYNQVKGSEQGMIFALKMFSLSCRIINIWVKKDPQIEENPDLIEEEALYDFTSYFLTSRFDIDFSSVSSVDFRTFNSNIGAFIKLVQSVKPIIKILNMIKFSIKIDEVNTVLVNSAIETSDLDTVFTYKITWTGEDAIEDIVSRRKYRASTNHITRAWFPFNCTSCVVTPGDIRLGNIYTLMCTLFAESDYKFAFSYSGKKKKDDTEVSFTRKKAFDMSALNFKVLETGFYVLPTDGDVATDLVEFINDLEEAETDSVEIVMTIEHIPGTRMIFCVTD